MRRNLHLVQRQAKAGHRLRGMLVEGFPGLGQLHTFAPAHQQLYAQLLLQFLEAFRYRRQGDVQQFRRCYQAAGADHREKNLEMPQVDGGQVHR
ncbi:hypothetical protein D3C77_668310 [compost metagenome]